MAKVIIEQFNNVSQCWNFLYEEDYDDFDSSEPYKMNKYNGPYRTRVVGNVEPEPTPQTDVFEPEEEEIDEEPIVEPNRFSFSVNNEDY